MKLLVTLGVFLLSLTISSQNLNKEAKEILQEGKALLKREQAAWHASDHLSKTLKELNQYSRGYVTYIDSDDKAVAVFYSSNKEVPLVRYTFNGTPAPITLVASLGDLRFTQLELDLIELRVAAIKEIIDNKERDYNFNESINPNVIPIIEGNKKIVYVLSGNSSPELLIGNDYKLLFNDSNEFVEREELHKTIVPFKIDKDYQIANTLHTHLIKDFITPTDICNLLLYKDYSGMKSHQVISANYVSILDLEKETLEILSTEDFEKKEKEKK